MVIWYWEKFLQRIGYRKFWYYPSRHGLHMSDFYNWEYRPDLESGEYIA